MLYYTINTIQFKPQFNHIKTHCSHVTTSDLLVFIYWYLFSLFSHYLHYLHSLFTLYFHFILLYSKDDHKRPRPLWSGGCSGSGSGNLSLIHSSPASTSSSCVQGSFSHFLRSEAAPRLKYDFLTFSAVHTTYPHEGLRISAVTRGSDICILNISVSGMYPWSWARGSY